MIYAYNYLKNPTARRDIPGHWIVPTLYQWRPVSKEPSLKTTFARSICLGVLSFALVCCTCSQGNLRNTFPNFSSLRKCDDWISFGSPWRVSRLLRTSIWFTCPVFWHSDLFCQYGSRTEMLQVKKTMFHFWILCWVHSKVCSAHLVRFALSTQLSSTAHSLSFGFSVVGSPVKKDKPQSSCPIVMTWVLMGNLLLSFGRASIPQCSEIECQLDNLIILHNPIIIQSLQPQVIPMSNWIDRLK